MMCDRNAVRALCMDVHDEDITLESFFSKDEHILVYGAGNIGKKIFNILSDAGHKPVAFLDRNANSVPMLEGVPVYLPEKMLGDSERYLVIIAVCMKMCAYDSLICELKKHGYSSFLNGYHILNYDMFRNEPRALVSTEPCMAQILKAFELLCDDTSREIFYQNLKAHLTGSYYAAPYDENLVQYFDSEIPLRKGSRCLVDCGAYIGDSLETALQCGTVENYYAFEPDEKNFSKLSETVDGKSDLVKQAVLFPCACGAKNEFLSFSSGGGGNSCLDEQGTSLVQVVRLDDVLKKVQPTMIKMDIEGAELEALAGAQKIIQSAQPDLAVCVYHKMTHLWEILLYLHELVPQYRFSLRSHFGFALETVLYATI